MDTETWVRTVIRGVMCLIGIIGNSWLFISSLPKSTSQLKTSDILFMNLAASNMITNYVVDFLDIFQVEQYLPVGNVFCGISFFLPEFSETSSIFTTVYITVYWHQKLVGSLKRGGAPVRMDNLQFVAVLLTASWTLAFVIHLPHFFFVAEIGENETAKCIEELPSPEADQAYEVIYIMIANVLTLITILYASIQIAITLLQNEKRMKNMGAAAKNEGKTSAEKSDGDTNNISAVTKSKSNTKTGSLLRAAKSVVAVAVLFVICWTIHLITRIVSSISTSSVIEEIESFIGASYTCAIPYIYLYGVQKLTCSCF